MVARMRAGVQQHAGVPQHAGARMRRGCRHATARDCHSRFGNGRPAACPGPRRHEYRFALRASARRGRRPDSWIADVDDGSPDHVPRIRSSRHAIADRASGSPRSRPDRSITLILWQKSGPVHRVYTLVRGRAVTCFTLSLFRRGKCLVFARGLPDDMLGGPCSIVVGTRPWRRPNRRMLRPARTGP